jgi:hypothetical protein
MYLFNSAWGTGEKGSRGLCKAEFWVRFPGSPLIKGINLEEKQNHQKEKNQKLTSVGQSRSFGISTQNS